MIKFPKKDKNKKIPKTVLDFIPFNEVWNNYVYLENDKIIGGIKIGSINLELLFYEEQKSKVSALKNILNGIDFPIKIMSVNKPINLDKNINILGTKLKNETNKNKAKLLEEDYKFIETLNSDKSAVNREFFLIVEETIDNEQLLKQKLNDLIQEFNVIGLPSSLITSEEWRDILYVSLNPLTSLDSFKKDASGITRSFKEKIAPTGIKIGEKDCIVDNAYTSVVTVISYPSMVDIGWLGTLSNVNNTRMMLSVSPLDSFEISNTLKKSISETKSKMINVSDYNDQILLGNQMQDYMELVNRIDREHEKFVKMTIMFFCYSETKEDLEKVKKELKSRLSAYGFSGSDLMFEQEKSFKMTLPAMYNELEKNFGLPVPMMTTASSFPFIYQNLQDSGDSMMLGVNSLGSLVFFDLWKRTNKRTNSNAVIIGKSGSGKSTLLKKLIRFNWGHGTELDESGKNKHTKIIIIDPEREYKELCESVHGNWIDCGTGISGIINPLEVRKTSDDEDKSNNDLAKHFQTFRTFIKYYFEGLTVYELTKLEEILIDVYKEKGIDFDTNISKLTSEDYPIMSDLYRKVEFRLNKAKSEKDAHNVIESLEKINSMLRRCIMGADARLFNGHSSININESSDFVVLDIHSLVDSDVSILRTQFFNILSWCWNEISSNRNEQVILVVDEAHLLIDPNNKDGIEFLKRAVKRIRKYSGSLWIATQNLIDFTGEGVERQGQVIIDNSTYLMVMGQGLKEIEAVTKMINLSDSEKAFLTNADKGKGLLIINQHERMPIQVLLRKEELDLFGESGGK
jgi:Domain of unknown function DUF87.